MNFYKLKLNTDNSILSKNKIHIEKLYDFTLDVVLTTMKGEDILIFINNFIKIVKYVNDTDIEDENIDILIENTSKFSIQARRNLIKIMNCLNGKFKLEINEINDKNMFLVYFCRKIVQMIGLNKPLQDLQTALQINISDYLKNDQDISKLFLYIKSNINILNFGTFISIVNTF